jgi:hypothetical protein
MILIAKGLSKIKINLYLITEYNCIWNNNLVPLVTPSGNPLVPP